MNYFARRRLRQMLVQGLKEARHIRNLREDLAEPSALSALDAAVQWASKVLKTGDWSRAVSAATELSRQIDTLTPKRSWAWLRENLEIMAVALAVAMAFRTYFVQPFKIPTSSMSPTLLGIQHLPQERPGWLDRTPLRLAKWLVFGSWYVEIRSWASGRVQVINTNDGRFFMINDRRRQVFEGMREHVADGQAVIRGQLLASGLRVAGDHIFVNKLSWNFRRPRRGEIMVFKTNGIKQLNQNEHYVKRLVGLPDETLGINTPDLIINGQKVMHPSSIVRVESAAAGYHGYQQMGTYLTNHVNRVQLAVNEFFACGDNQRNSLDSRYWGPVKHENLVGPAFVVYWPFSRRWGKTD